MAQLNYRIPRESQLELALLDANIKNKNLEKTILEKTFQHNLTQVLDKLEIDPATVQTIDLDKGFITVLPIEPQPTTNLQEASNEAVSN